MGIECRSSRQWWPFKNRDNKPSNSGGNPFPSLLDHQPYRTRLGEVSVLVDNNVFAPDISYSTLIVLDNFPRRRKLRNKLVADVGTGTGILAITAAKKGAEVVATDVSDIAINNAQINIENNSVDDRVRLVKTNLLDGVDGQFDIIFANLPIRESVWGLDTASLMHQMLIDAKSKLNSGGRIYFPWGSFAEKKRRLVEEYLAQEGYSFKLKTKRRLGYTWYLYTASLDQPLEAFWPLIGTRRRRSN